MIVEAGLGARPKRTLHRARFCPKMYPPQPLECTPDLFRFLSAKLGAAKVKRRSFFHNRATRAQSNISREFAAQRAGWLGKGENANLATTSWQTKRWHKPTTTPDAQRSTLHHAQTCFGRCVKRASAQIDCLKAQFKTIVSMLFRNTRRGHRSNREQSLCATTDDARGDTPGAARELEPEQVHPLC